MKIFDASLLGQATTLSQAAEQCLVESVPAILVSVAATRGSVPRERDTMMLVCAARSVGTIGGGHLEWHAIKRARALLASGPAIDCVEPLTLGPSLGQCCGGSVQLRYRSLTAMHQALIQGLDRPLFHLNLFGAGHVGQAVVRALSTVPCTIRWVDERADIFPVGIPDSTIARVDDIPEDEVADCSPGDFYLVMTHSHARDESIVSAVLARGDAGYLGLIGSRSKRVRFERRLRRRGLDPKTMHCPIGISGSRGKEPWRIALSVANDLLDRV